MKRLTILASVLVAATLLISPALAQQPMGQPSGQPPGMGPGMMGGGQMGQGMMMCPMMHQMMQQMMMGGQMGQGGMGMMGMMGGPADPKTQARMLQMRGEMLKAAGDILLKYGKMLEEGK